MFHYFPFKKRIPQPLPSNFKEDLLNEKLVGAIYQEYPCHTLSHHVSLIVASPCFMTHKACCSASLGGGSGAFQPADVLATQYGVEAAEGLGERAVAQCGAPGSVQLANITPITMVYGNISGYIYS